MTGRYLAVPVIGQNLCGNIALFSSTWSSAMEVVLHEVSNVQQHAGVGQSVRIPMDANPMVKRGLSAERGGAVFTQQLQKEPIDISFDNVTFTASMGFRKGRKLIHTYSQKLGFLLLHMIKT